MICANRPYRTRQPQLICADWNDFGRKTDAGVVFGVMASARPAVEWLPDRTCSG